MSRSALRFLCLLALLTEACSTDTSNTGPTTRTPSKRRPTAEACPSTRAPGKIELAPPDAGPDGAAASPSYEVECYKDGDCTQGKDGRCNTNRAYGSPQQKCSYSACTTDADCPTNTACVCNDFGGNFCAPSNCRIDSDCKANLGCSPQTYGGYFCRTTADQCGTDADCPRMGRKRICSYNKTSQAWMCAIDPKSPD